METIEANDVDHDSDGADANETQRDDARGTLRTIKPVPLVLDDNPPEVKPEQTQ